MDLTREYKATFSEVAVLSDEPEASAVRDEIATIVTFFESCLSSSVRDEIAAGASNALMAVARRHLDQHVGTLIGMSATDVFYKFPLAEGEVINYQRMMESMVVAYQRYRRNEPVFLIELVEQCVEKKPSISEMDPEWNSGYYKCYTTNYLVDWATTTVTFSRQ